MYTDISYMKVMTMLYLIWWEYYLPLLLQALQLDRNIERHLRPLEFAPVGCLSN